MAITSDVDVTVVLRMTLLLMVSVVLLCNCDNNNVSVIDMFAFAVDIAVVLLIDSTIIPNKSDNNEMTMTKTEQIQTRNSPIVRLPISAQEIIE